MMKPFTSSSFTLDVPPLTAAAAATGIEPLGEQVTTLINELAASRDPRTPMPERRREHRIRCSVPSLLVALADNGQALDVAPWKVTIRDLSRSGIGIAHPEPMPYRLVLLSFETAASEPVRLLARLKWCRFKHTGVHESGGQVLRVFKPGEP